MHDLWVLSVDLPEGPVDVVWDKAPCAACSMHVGEPPYAAQLTTTAGRTHVFDDPGCLFLWLDENEVEIHSMYFRHVDEERCLRCGAGQVAPGSLTYAEAGKKCLDRVARYRSK